jgi:ferric-dicitrate binding protein FerR (iron transport regulator)
MPTNVPSSLIELVGKLADDRLTSDDSDRLRELLSGNPEAQRYYCEYLDLHQELNSRFETVGLIASGNTFGDSIAENSRTPARYFALPRRLVVMLTMGSFATAALILVLLSGRASIPAAKEAAMAPSTVSQQATVRRIQIKSGASVFSIDGVGTVTLEGPADLTLLGPMRARLDRGRMRMRVTQESGRGYVVETPDGDVTDLGTEFGLSVAAGKQSALAVFEGAVDLLVAGQTIKTPHIERLLGGDGVLFNKGGKMERLNSILTGSVSAFSVCDESPAVEYDLPLISDVYDNLPSETTRRYYEIVPGGMQEDSLAFVDRLQHNWNGLSRGHGLPLYLRKADYVKTFCEDKLRTNSKFTLTVVLSRPAKLFVLFDKRLDPPQWLTESFTKTEDSVGLDMGKWYSLDETPSPSREIGTGPGQSLDLEFAVWEQIVNQRGAVKLGPNGRNPLTERRATMYGIAAVEYPLVVKKPIVKSKTKSKKAKQTVHVKAKSNGKDN